MSDFTGLCQKVHDVGGKVIVASDLLACTILKPPGEMGADIVVGSNQVTIFNFSKYCNFRALYHIFE